jgi:hypothetical protein
VTTSSATASVVGSRRYLAVTLAGVLLIGVVLGYWIGTGRSGVSEHVGRAYATDAQIGIETDDWTYSVPLDVYWRDPIGTWHSGRPSCLPPGVDRDVRFAAVPVEVGIGFRQVVAVFCD